MIEQGFVIRINAAKPLKLSLALSAQRLYLTTCLARQFGTQDGIGPILDGWKPAHQVQQNRGVH